MDPAMTDEPGAFEARFRRALLHLRWRSILHGVATLLPWLEGAWLVAFLVERAGYPLLPRLWTLAALATVLIIHVGFRLWRTPVGRSAALVLDRCLGTRELVTTAQEATSSDESHNQQHALVQLARQRATTELTPTQVAAALPLTGWRGWRPTLLGLVAILLTPFLPLPQPGAEAIEAIDPVVETTAEALAEELEPLMDEAAEMDRPQAEEALERLQELVDEMQQGELPTVDEALVALTELEETLRQLAENEPAPGFDTLVQDLGAEPLSADLAEAMTSIDRDALRQSLERMGEALSAPDAQSEAMQKQMERLQERLRQMAGLLEASGEPELAAALRELADALAAGDLEKAREMLESEEVAGACQAAGDRAGDERLADKLGSQLAELMQLGRFLLGQDPATLSSSGASPPRLGSRRGRGPRPGTETTNREGQGYTTGDPILRDRLSGESSSWQEDFEALYGSQLRSGGGQDLHIEGQIGAEGELLSQTGHGLGLVGEGSMPLRPFAAPGAGAAERATDLESVPLGYRDLVRRYFERNPSPSTEPGNTSQGENH